LEVFHRGGYALGSGVAPLLDWLNLGLVIAYLPPSMKDARDDQVGSAFIEGMKKALREQVFSNGGDITLDLRCVPLDEVEARGVAAAASLVLERTIENLESNVDLPYAMQ